MPCACTVDGERAHRRCLLPGFCGKLSATVLAANTCISWWSLPQNGSDDKIDGSLLLEH
jgi:hypothetical protein